MNYVIYLCPKCDGNTYQLYYDRKSKPRRHTINRKYCPKCDIILKYDSEKKPQ